jgi:hypothetical protein
MKNNFHKYRTLGGKDKIPPQNFKGALLARFCCATSTGKQNIFVRFVFHSFIYRRIYGKLLYEIWRSLRENSHVLFTVISHIE